MKTPPGWIKLRNGTVLKDDDKCVSEDGTHSHKTWWAGHKIGSSNHTSGIYIRRKPKTKKK